MEKFPFKINNENLIPEKKIKMFHAIDYVLFLFVFSPYNIDLAVCLGAGDAEQKIRLK